MRLLDVSRALTVVLLATAAGCEKPAVPAEYPQGQYPQGQYPQGQYPQGQYPPQSFPPPAAPPQPNDPITTVDLVYLRGVARSVMAELIGALPAEAQARVRNVPFLNDPTQLETNAYAACKGDQPFMAITDGLLTAEAYIAQLRAADELFGTRTLDAYFARVKQEQRPRQPVVTIPLGLVDPVQSADARKVTRQHELFEEQVAFVLGHELAHHHLGHTGCANGQSGDRPATLFGDAARLLSQIVPPMSQVMEGAADSVGLDDVLAAGARSGRRWSEQGALLTLDYFAHLDTPTLTGFFTGSHPSPSIRAPYIQREAARFRASGGVWWRPPVDLP